MYFSTDDYEGLKSDKVSLIQMIECCCDWSVYRALCRVSLNPMDFARNRVKVVAKGLRVVATIRSSSCR